MVNGNTVVLQSYLASLQELFPTGDDRALAVARQTPFMLLTYVLSAAPVLIAFSSNPDMGTQCCASSRTNCAVRPACACFANSSVWDGALQSPALSDSAALYHPAYTAVCASGFLGGATGAAAATPAPFAALADLAAARATACAVEPIPYSRFAVCAALTAVMGMCVYLAVPPARTNGAKDAARAMARGGEPAPPSLLPAIVRTFRSPPFRWYALQALLATTWSSFVLANFALYLIYIADIEPATAVGSSVVIGVVMVAARVALIPAFTRVILRFPTHAHPARVLGYLRVLEATLTPLLFWALKQPSVDLNALLVVAGLLIGVCSSPYDMCNHMLVGWAIDEDELSRPAGAPRREGMFYACNAMVQHLSQVLISGALAGWGAAGYDAAICPSAQPPSASAAIEFSFMLALPLISVLAAAASFLYPIQGARLRSLKERKATGSRIPMSTEHGLAKNQTAIVGVPDMVDRGPPQVT